MGMCVCVKHFPDEEVGECTTHASYQVDGTIQVRC